ncbi:unnamed protein product [Medioppia subpectinata]|uniref:Uncharacterized protein n=1 Tax=Medioppia subpectinata TaxID=1979941 RepID=A0A7R9Q6B9_9ACAR|nr:unnamed protein product [Medioppia subpectinata]CAG2114363.1 unnamed protein product [Medioppia subpectinata]
MGLSVRVIPYELIRLPAPYDSGRPHESGGVGNGCRERSGGGTQYDCLQRCYRSLYERQYGNTTTCYADNDLPTIELTSIAINGSVCGHDCLRTADETLQTFQDVHEWPGVDVRSLKRLMTYGVINDMVSLPSSRPSPTISRIDHNPQMTDQQFAVIRRWSKTLGLDPKYVLLHYKSVADFQPMLTTEPVLSGVNHTFAVTKTMRRQLPAPYGRCSHYGSDPATGAEGDGSGQPFRATSYWHCMRRCRLSYVRKPRKEWCGLYRMDLYYHELDFDSHNGIITQANNDCANMSMMDKRFEFNGINETKANIWCPKYCPPDCLAIDYRSRVVNDNKDYIQRVWYNDDRPEDWYSEDRLVWDSTQPIHARIHFYENITTAGCGVGRKANPMDNKCFTYHPNSHTMFAGIQNGRVVQKGEQPWAVYIRDNFGSCYVNCAAPDFRVYPGLTNQSYTNQTYYTGGQYFIHPEWERNQHRPYDLGLLRLNTAIPLDGTSGSSGINSICLPEEMIANKEEEYVQLVGFGVDSDNRTGFGILRTGFTTIQKASGGQNDAIRAFRVPFPTGTGERTERSYITKLFYAE